MFNYTIKTNEQGTAKHEWKAEDYTLTVIKFKSGEIKADIESDSDHVNLLIEDNLADEMLVAARICASRAMTPGQLFGHMRKVEQATEVAGAFQNILDSM